MDESTVNVPVITALELKGMMDDGRDFILLDVRSIVGYQRERIPKAIHISHTQLEARLGELDSSKPVVVYCASPTCMAGPKAIAILSKAGFNALNFESGIAGWKQAGFPLEGDGQSR